MGKWTAVVIDDESDLAQYQATILEENGFEVQTALNAADGEALIRQNPPDLVLLDLMMPGRSGIQLFAKLRGDPATKDIPLIMVTGIKEQMGIDWGEIVDKLKTRRPDGFIEKPVEPEGLMKVVSKVLSSTKGDDEVVHG